MCLDISITYYTEYSKRKKKLHLQRKCFLSSYLHVSLTCLFLSRLLIKYEIDIHVCYNLQNNFFYQNYRSVLFMVNNFTKNKLEKEIQYPILELQNISVEEIDGCQFDSIVITRCKFIRLNPRKKGPFQFCLPALLGIHRNSKQKEFFRFSEGFLI